MTDFCKICKSNETCETDCICKHCKILRDSLTKVCSKCDRELPSREYYNDRHKKDGLKTICKDCCLNYYKENVKKS